MNTRQLTLVVAASALVLAAAGYGLYTLGLRRGSSETANAHAQAAASTVQGGTAPARQTLPQSIAEGEAAARRHIANGLKAGDLDPTVGVRVLYYQDPMSPGTKFDKPGKSPFMDMMLVPVYADAGSDQGSVTVSARVQQSLGVRTAEVVEASLSPQLSAVGSIAFNERDQAVVQARASGYVERLHVRATLDAVAKDQPLVDLFVPEWVGAQEEFLSIKRMQGRDLDTLVDGARQRMRLLGMSDVQIGRVEASGKAQTRTTITAPIAGVVTELLVREGMAVAVGATLFRINGLSSVWANAEVPEGQAAVLRVGAKVQATSPAVPGETFEGKVQALLPDVNLATRTLKARVELANPKARLVPGMSVSVLFMDVRANKVLQVPSESVIMTGKRSVVMLAEGNGKFRSVEVETGVESGGQTEIKRGLQSGQRVVVSAQFLIDSEASLKGVEAQLNDAPGAGAISPAVPMPASSAPMSGRTP